jgi:hypothetical protein
VLEQKMSGQTGKVLGLVIMLALLGVVGTMSLLGANGSIVIFAITAGLGQWAQLIALGVALGIFFYFMPSKKSMKL